MSDLVSIASTAVNAYQRALGTVSNNIANVDSVGYSRQEVNLTENAPRAYGTSYLGTGVNVDGVRRLYDAFIENSLRNATAELGTQEPLVNYANRVVDIMGSEDVGLVSAFDEFFDAARQLSTDPSSVILRSQFLNKTELLTERFQTIHTQLGLVDQETVEATNSEVASLNTLSQQLALVNRQLGKVKLLDRQPPSLLDQRDQLLRDMSKLAKINVTEAINGSVTVSIGSSATRGQIVQNDVAKPLKAVYTGSDAGRVSLVINAGSPQAETIIGFSGGSISGLMAFRSQLLQPSYAQLDSLAQTFVSEVNAIHAEGIDLNGANGLNLLKIDPQFSLKAELGDSDVSFEAAIDDGVGYLTNDIRLTYQADAGQRENLSLGGVYSVGEQITVTLNERSQSFTISGAMSDGTTVNAGLPVSLDEVTLQLKHFLDGGDADSEDGAFGRMIEVSQTASGGLVVTSNRLGAFDLSLTTSSTEGQVYNSTTRGLWIARDLVNDTVVSGAQQIDINGISIRLNGQARDGEELTFSVANSAAAGIRVAIQEPEEVAAAARFRVIENQFNPGGASATLTEVIDLSQRDETAPIDALTADDADGRVLDNNGLNDSDVVLNFDRVPAAPLAVVPAGFSDTALFLGDLNDEVVDLQVITREGVHLLGRHFAEDRIAEAEVEALAEGRTLSDSERDELIQQAGDEFLLDARRAGATLSSDVSYSARYLNASGAEAYRGLDLFYGVRAGVERVAPLTLDHVPGPVVVTPASIESEQISITPNSAGVVFEEGDLTLNGVELSALSGFSAAATVDAEDVLDWIYAQDGWGHGEIQTLYFSEAETTGSITVGGVSATVTAGDSAATVATKVATALRANTLITGYSGRSVDINGDGSLSFNFSLTDGNPDELSFAGGSTGVIMEVTTDPRAAGPLGRGEEKTLSFETPTTAGVVSIAGVSVTVTSAQSAATIAGNVKTALEASTYMTANPLRRIELNDDGTLTIRYPYQEGPVDDPELKDPNETGLGLTTSSEPFEGVYAELTYTNNSSGALVPYGLRLSQTIFEGQAPSRSEVRLGLGETGRATDLAKLGFRTGAYLIGEIPEDLIVFATGDDTGSSFSLGGTWTNGSQNRVEELRRTPFEVVFTESNAYEIRDVLTGTVLSARRFEAGDAIEYRGVGLSLSSAPIAGDRFLVDGNRDGIGNNGNALRLAALQTEKVVGGGVGLTFSEAYSEIVTEVGNTAFQASISQKALTVVHDQATQARDKVSGVSLDEEAADLIRFQQAYQASAKVMQTASTIFDAILQVR